MTNKKSTLQERMESSEDGKVLIEERYADRIVEIVDLYSRGILSKETAIAQLERITNKTKNEIAVILAE